MKRDLDLARQLLFGIEKHGQDCSLTVLRNGYSHEPIVEDVGDRVRYHLRLLVDAGLAREVDHTTAGTPCVRLTHDGHELLDLARNEDRWHAAKRAVYDATGAVCLTAVRSVLLQWAVEGSLRGESRYARVAAPYRAIIRERPAYRPYYHRVEPRRRYEPPRYAYREAAPMNGYNNHTDERELRLTRERPDYRERLEPIAAPVVRDEYLRDDYGRDDAYARDYRYASAYTTAYTTGYPVERFEYDTQTVQPAPGVTVPVYLV